MYSHLFFIHFAFSFEFVTDTTLTLSECCKYFSKTWNSFHHRRPGKIPATRFLSTWRQRIFYVHSASFLFVHSMHHFLNSCIASMLRAIRTTRKTPTLFCDQIDQRTNLINNLDTSLNPCAVEKAITCIVVSVRHQMIIMIRFSEVISTGPIIILRQFIE